MTKMANHRWLKFLFLLPILIMIAFSMYFHHLAQEIDNVLIHACTSNTQAQIYYLNHISTWINVGSVVLIAVTTILNVVMVLVIINLSKTHRSGRRY